MWFFWWNGRGGGARFIWWFFIMFFAFNFFLRGFLPIVILAVMAFMMIRAMRGVSELTGDESTRRRRTPYTSSRRVQVGERPRTVTMPPRMSEPEDTAQEHAIMAARAVGINPQTASITPIDIGVIAYDADETTVHRTWRIAEDADALQPFVNLRVKQAARGRLRFEIHDDKGQMVFFYERDYSFSVGENLIMPPARMPIDQSSDKSGEWTLRVLGDNLPLAEHSFEWHEAGSTDFEGTIGADGEISDDMRVALARTRLDRMSLDELLNDEGDESATRRNG
jgi:hypothetical protein